MNGTSIVPSGTDLFLALPRLARKVRSFAFSYAPEHMDALVGKASSSGSVIAEGTSAAATSNATLASLARNGTGTFAQGAAQASRTAAAVTTADPAVPSFLSFQTLRNMGGMFTYLTSKWALATFATAVILNRTQFYASSRIPLQLQWNVRLALYLVPILLFICQAQWLLQGIRCQTAPDWSAMQYGGPTRWASQEFSGEGGFLYWMSSTLLFWQSDADSCAAVNMAPYAADSPRKAGSLALLWPFFLSLLLGQFVETLACALQGRQAMPETGMTIFEHSLAFAEAESMVTRRFAPGKLVKLKVPNGDFVKVSAGGMVSLLNVPPEVLAIALISTMSHLCSNVLAVAGVRARFRLVTTGIWGVAYIIGFVWSMVRATTVVGDPETELGLLRFPTVCIVGFIPHVLILFGILACGLIYGLALLLTAVSPPPGQDVPATFTGRFRAAYNNLQANAHLSAGAGITINWQEDFYTALLKVGFTVLTAASEAVYLNEGNRVNVYPMTWLESDRLRELTTQHGLVRRSLDTVPSELRGDFIAEGLGSRDLPDAVSGTARTSGYARERKTRTEASRNPEVQLATGRNHGVGLLQRRGRWLTTIQLIKGVFWLLLAFWVESFVGLLRILCINYRPRWLLRMVGRDANGEKRDGYSSMHGPGIRRGSTDSNLLMTDDAGNAIALGDLDVEEQVRRRLAQGSDSGAVPEDTLNDNLYNWWKSGGRWGDVDNSGDYAASSTDDDTTSVISTATSFTTDRDDWTDASDDNDASGRRTPTQRNPFPSTRDSTPVPENPLDTAHLAALLDPKSAEQREEARVLARHLQASGPLTRSAYKRALALDRSKVVTSSRLFRASASASSASASTSTSPPTDLDDEEAALEQFILDQRARKQQQQQQQQQASSSNPPVSSAGSGPGRTWATGAEGMGESGPQCVVCQTNPRTVLLWPCGCLSLCDECRVGLATKNFAACVCCRTDVVAYSRLFVP